MDDGGWLSFIGWKIKKYKLNKICYFKN
jgi:hypothetical protein